MARDDDFHSDDNQAWRGRSGGERYGYGRSQREDYASSESYGDAGYRGARDRFGGRSDEGRSWQGRDRYGADYGERLYADRVAGRGQGYGEGGHSLEGFGRGRLSGSDYGRRGYGQTGVGQNANDQGGYGQTGYGQSGINQDDYSPSRDYYGADGGARGAYRGDGYRSGGYGGQGGDFGRDANANSYLSDIAGGEHRGRGPKNYTRSDGRIAEDINDRLSDAGDLNASDIEVDVKNGEVTLSGTVSDRRAKRRAEDLADAVSGAKHVQNNLRVADRTETLNSISADQAGGLTGLGDTTKTRS